MKETASVGPASERSYQIGTVASLTGVDPHTIRAWERRHRAISPGRSDTGRRRYDDRTIERLQLLKALVDCNESIGTIAHLSDSELRARLERLAEIGDSRSRGAAFAADAGPRRLALMAPGLEAQLRANAVAFPELEIAVSRSARAPDGPDGQLDGQPADPTDRDAAELLVAARRERCEMVVLELDALRSRALSLVRACRDLPQRPLVIVLYRFAPRPALARLAQAGARLVQSPVRLEQLRRILHDQRMIERARVQSSQGVNGLASAAAGGTTEGTASEPATPARRFDDEQLSRLFEVSSGVDCECPNHLASLVAALVSFERYSLSCESRDEADARLHQQLGTQTGAARALLESLLADLCEHEGIAI